MDIIRVLLEIFGNVNSLLLIKWTIYQSHACF